MNGIVHFEINADNFQHAADFYAKEGSPCGCRTAKHSRRFTDWQRELLPATGRN